MSYVDFIRNANRQQIEQVLRQISEAQQVSPGLVRAMAHHVERNIEREVNRWCPPGFTYNMPDQWVELTIATVNACITAALMQANAVMSQLQEINEYLGSPDRMREMGAAFGDVGDAAKSLQIHKDQLKSLLTWDTPDGEPAEYEYAIEEQIIALGRIAPAAEKIKDTLRGHADDIEKFYLDVADLLSQSVVAIGGAIGALLSLIAAALSSETGVGLVVGIVAAAISLGVACLGVQALIIPLLQGAMEIGQAVANKLDDFDELIPEWYKPVFAMVQ